MIETTALTRFYGSFPARRASSASCGQALAGASLAALAMGGLTEYFTAEDLKRRIST